MNAGQLFNLWGVLRRNLATRVLPLVHCATRRADCARKGRSRPKFLGCNLKGMGPLIYLHGLSIEFLYFKVNNTCTMEVQIFSTLSDMELNEWIKAARLSKKLTQDQLAEALDLTKGNVSAWEVGRHEPSYGTLVKIIEITGFKGPLPGLGAPIVTESEWPFQKVSKEKVVALDGSDRAQLEACIILSAAQLGLDVKK